MHPLLARQTSLWKSQVSFCWDPCIAAAQGKRWPHLTACRIQLMVPSPPAAINRRECSACSAWWSPSFMAACRFPHSFLSTSSGFCLGSRKTCRHPVEGLTSLASESAGFVGFWPCRSRAERCPDGCSADKGNWEAQLMRLAALTAASKAQIDVA